MPTALPFVAAGIGAAGSLESASAQQQSANYQAQVAQNNATVAGYNANNAIQAGQQQTTEQGLKGAAISGKTRVALAANGIDVNSGSAADVQAGQRSTNQLESLTTMHNAYLQAYGYQNQAQNFQNTASLETAAGQQAMTGGILGAAGSFAGSQAGGGLLNSLSTKWQLSNEGLGGAPDTDNSPLDPSSLPPSSIGGS